VSQVLTDETRQLLLSHFGPLLNLVTIFEAAGAVAKIDLSLKPNHHDNQLFKYIDAIH